ncbi:MAG TPA: hypothetical protein VHY76_01745, partial [Acetobacteraceae bacterium]|nr:hypothetical protein [Acetobacteraceae bacterium]
MCRLYRLGRGRRLERGRRLGHGRRLGRGRLSWNRREPGRSGQRLDVVRGDRLGGTLLIGGLLNR